MKTIDEKSLMLAELAPDIAQALYRTYEDIKSGCKVPWMPYGPM